MGLNNCFVHAAIGILENKVVSHLSYQLQLKQKSLLCGLCITINTAAFSFFSWQRWCLCETMEDSLEAATGRALQQTGSAGLCCEQASAGDNEISC